MVPVSIEEAQRGNLAGLTGADLGPAWTQVAEALRCLASREVRDRPAVVAVRAKDGFDGPGAVQALELLGLRSLLALDRVALEESIEALVDFGEDGNEAQLHLSGWLAYLQGDGESAQEYGQDLEARSRARGQSMGVVQGAVLAAAGLLSSGSPPEALQQVRRAARMAQSERLWTSNFLAGILLARARRMNGQAYLAARVASACRSASGGEWAAWLDWEIFFAGSTPCVMEHPRPIDKARMGVAAWLSAGERPPGPSSLGSAPHDTDVACALFAGGAPIDTTQTNLDAVRTWVDGAAESLPGIISGVAIHAARRGAARVIVRSSSSARRTLCAPRDVTHVPPSGTEATRVEVLIAVLAFADAPLGRRALFEAAYGFKYRPEIHEDAFKVLRSQAKNFITGRATLDSTDGYVLRVHEDFSVIDPRCKQPTNNVILGRLGQIGQSNARRLSETLGIPLRTVQAALKGLVEDGACEMQRFGRRIEYIVEDTTFREITFA